MAGERVLFFLFFSRVLKNHKVNEIYKQTRILSGNGTLGKNGGYLYRLSACMVLSWFYVFYMFVSIPLFLNALFLSVCLSVCLPVSVSVSVSVLLSSFVSFFFNVNK